MKEFLSLEEKDDLTTDFQKSRINKSKHYNVFFKTIMESFDFFRSDKSEQLTLQIAQTNIQKIIEFE